MKTNLNKTISLEVIDGAFNNGDLSVIDKYIDPNGVDHQEPPGTPFATHLKQVVMGLRLAFPDLHFDVHDILAEGDIVAFRSTMTGTHEGVLNVIPQRQIPATGRKIAVPHMHFVRIVNGKTTDLWHVWNVPMMLQQLGILPEQQPSHS